MKTNLSVFIFAIFLLFITPAHSQEWEEIDYEDNGGERWFQLSHDTHVFIYSENRIVTQFSAGDIVPISLVVRGEVIKNLLKNNAQYYPDADFYCITRVENKDAFFIAPRGKWIDHVTPEIKREYERVARENLYHNAMMIVDDDEANEAEKAEREKKDGISRQERRKMIRVLRDEKVVKTIKEGEELSDDELISLYHDAYTRQQLRRIKREVRDLKNVDY